MQEPALIPNETPLAELHEDPVARITSLPAELWGEAPSIGLQIPRRFRTGKICERRKYISEIHQVLQHPSTLDRAFPRRNQGHVRANMSHRAFAAANFLAIRFG